MAEHLVTFDLNEEAIEVPTGTLLTEAAREAGVEIQQPCGGQGRCGRCVIRVASGQVRHRSQLRLLPEDIQAGYALACQSIVEGDVKISVPPQEKVERRLATDRVAAEVSLRTGYVVSEAQTLKRLPLTLSPPTMDNQTDDWSRLQAALRQEYSIESPEISLDLLRQMGPKLRGADWDVSIIVDTPWDGLTRVIDIQPKRGEETPLWGAAIDIGTTTVSLWLVDLRDGQVKAQVAEYNQQITRGEDVISRIIYANKNDGGQEMSRLVIETINGLLDQACKRVRAIPREILKATVAGNSTMIHLLLNLPSESIRLTPFVTGVNHPPTLPAKDLGLDIHPEARVDCLPGVASYVGADISAGVLSSGMADEDSTSLFMDIGTNGETVLGSQEWLVTCACSAGPAFEGAGVVHGMRATKGAIEEVWINSQTYEPTTRVIGGIKPRGLCGSGLISLMAELFLTGIIDKGGNFKANMPTERVREGEHGDEYVIAWADETSSGKDIAITHVDIDNLLRAKAAIYAGFTILADSVGVSLEAVERVLIGGAFGKYINLEKAIEIGLLPDMPWGRFQFLGNTSVKGAYLALIDKEARARIQEIASKLTYIELSADNSFYNAFTSALFLPHTDLGKFPSVARAFQRVEAQEAAGD